MTGVQEGGMFCYGALGIAADKAFYDGDRPVPVTDYGKAVGAMFG